MLDIKNIPYEIKSYIFNKTITENIIGCEIGNVYKITDNNNSSIYLKIKEKTPNFDLKREYSKTLWLSNIFHVPKVLNYSLFDDKEYFLMEELKGYMSYESQYFESNEQIIKLIAKSLKKLHSIDIFDCPFHETLKTKISKAKYNVDNNLVDESDFDDENLGNSSIELFKKLLSKLPKEEYLVLTHGDYCMPNIIIDNDLNVGFIDLGRFGVADRYQDISLILRSLEDNFNTKNYNELFLSEYGLKEIDNEKLTFYRLLDEFF
jgi:aminoglycoside phosphotransferase